MDAQSKDMLQTEKQARSASEHGPYGVANCR